MIAIDSKVHALARQLGYDLVRIDCSNAVCKQGYSPAGGRCNDCGGLGYTFEAERMDDEPREMDVV